MPYFVFLEFFDRHVSSFLNELRTALHPRGRASPVHVTLRGPYVEPPDPDQLRSLRGRLRGHGVQIAGAGEFSTPNGYAVFLRARSIVFQELWWKPDYPIRGKQIEPHITLFESEDKTSADIVLRFLRTAPISILAYNVDLSIYTSRQGSLFGPVPSSLGDRSVRLPRDLMAVDENVLSRARALGLSIRSGRAES